MKKFHQLKSKMSVEAQASIKAKTEKLIAKLRIRKLSKKIRNNF